MSIFMSPAFDAHEAVHAFFDRETGLRGFIAIHSTRLGPAFGGCRIWSYENEQDALDDALRLSRGMSYKNALADLPFGGGKAVIMGDPDHPKSPALFHAFGRVVENLNGHYITAEDVGVNVGDMREVARVTRHVSGVAQSGAGGDPSPRTAQGVLMGIKAAIRFAYERDSLKGLTVAVQGIGNVGFQLCRLLKDEGADLIVADVNLANSDRAAEAFGAKVVRPSEILFRDADVLAPCALGGILNEDTIWRIRARIVAGAANNQLATSEDAKRLMDLGILYAPDYVINAGGIISVAAERVGETDEAVVTNRINRIYTRTLAILRRAHEERRTPEEVADAMADEKLAHAPPRHTTAPAALDGEAEGSGTPTVSVR